MPNSIAQADFSHPQQTSSIPGTQVPMGFQQITSTASAASLTVPTVTSGSQVVSASFALIQAATQGLVWRDDGVAPTATVGMVIPAGAELLYNGNLAKLQLIAQTAGAVANITYYG